MARTKAVGPDWVQLQNRFKSQQQSLAQAEVSLTGANAEIKKLQWLLVEVARSVIILEKKEEGRMKTLTDVAAVLTQATDELTTLGESVKALVDHATAAQEDATPVVDQATALLSRISDFQGTVTGALNTLKPPVGDEVPASAIQTTPVLDGPIVEDGSASPGPVEVTNL